MVTTNQKPTIDTQKQRERNPNIKPKKNHQTTGKTLKEEEKRTTKTTRTQVTI